MGLCHGHPVGPLASLQSSSRLKWCSRMRRPMSVCLPIGLVFLRRGCEPLPSMLNRRQRREFEQKAAKETKVNQGLGLCHGHPVRTSASLQSSSSSLRSRRTRSRHIGPSPSSGHRGKRRPADTLIRAPCVWATALKHRERLENPRVAEGPSPTFSVANDRHGNPIPNAPLFPLLPSVQIFFAAFC